jgi:hypothetical protein
VVPCVGSVCCETVDSRTLHLLIEAIAYTHKEHCFIRFEVLMTVNIKDYDLMGM